MTEGAAPRYRVRARQVRTRLARWLLRGFAPILSGWNVLHSETLDCIEQRRTFILLPFALVAGIIVYRIVGFEPASQYVAVGALLAVLLAVAMRSRAWALPLVAAAIGFAALPVHSALFGTAMLNTPKYGYYEMRLDSVVFDDGEAQRWLVSSISATDDRDDPGVRRARLAAPGGVAVQPGDVIESRVRFYPVPAPVLPGGYDAQFTGYFAGIGAYGSILGEPLVIPAKEGGVYRLIEHIRKAIADRILAVLKPNIGGIAMALINGDQSRVTEEDWATMALVGLAHVLSVSGLHLTLAAGTMYVTIRVIFSLVPEIGQRLPEKKIAAAGGIVIAIGYMLISGLQIPAIRSTIMLVLVFGAVIAGRQALTMRNVALAGLVLAFMDPASVFRASYQLSFAAVVALIAAFELARHKREDSRKQRNRAVAMIVDVTMTSLVAGGATLMFTAFHFQQTAPFGVLGNLLATPLVSFVMMPSALFAMLLAPFGLEAPLLIVMGWSIEAMLWIAHLVGVLSGGFDPSPLLAPSALAVCLGALAWLAFYQSRMRLVGPVLAVPLIFLFCTEPSPDVLIADSTQAVAVRHEDGLSLLAGRLNTFATNVWSERYMEPVGPRHEDTGCDSTGCILTSSRGYSVTLALSPAVLAEDCSLADLVIARFPVPQACRAATTVIDSTDLSSGGVQALYWHPETETFTIRAAINDAGRPWRSVKDQ